MKFLFSRIITFCLLSLFLSLNSFGQKKVKYKNVFEEVVTSDIDKAYALLLSYHEQNNLHINSAYQLAVICKEYSEKIDPLTKTEIVRYFIEYEKFYLELISTRFDEREIRKNKKYYGKIATLKLLPKIQLSDVLNDLANRLSENQEAASILDSVLFHFHSTRRFYNKCLENYKILTDTYHSVDEMYLLANNDITGTINQIKTDFENTLNHFKNYRALIEKHPLSNYNQYWTTAPIKHFRVDGLTDSDFLLEEVKLWDFEKWTTDFESVLENEIKPLRSKINSTEEELNHKIEQIKTGSYKNASVDYQLVEKLSQYDSNPLVLHLFRYKIAKADILNIQNEKPDSSKIGFVPVGTDITHFSRLAVSKNKADSLLEILLKNIDNQSVARYSAFITDKYYGEKGLRRYVANEKEYLNTLLSNSLGELKLKILSRRFALGNEKYASWKNDSIPLFPQTADFDNNPKQKYHTTTIDFDGDGNLLVAGFYAVSSNKKGAFLAKISDNKTEWVKVYNIRAHIQKTFNDCVLLLNVVNDKCHLVVNSSLKAEGNTQMFNTLVITDFNGKELSRTKLTPNLIPRAMYVDQSREKHIIVFKGDRFNPIAHLGKTEKEPNEHLVIHGVEEDDVWTTEIEMTGCVGGITKIDENYIVFANYSRFTNHFSENIRSKSAPYDDVKDRTNIFSTLVNSKGSLMKTGKLESKLPIFGICAHKINTKEHYGTIVIGFSENLKSFANPEKLKKASVFYLVTDQFGDTYSSNLTD